MCYFYYSGKRERLSMQNKKKLVSIQQHEDTIKRPIILPTRNKKGFVSIQHNHFSIGDSAFFPIVLNYFVSMQGNKKELWPCPTKNYDPNNKFRFTTKDSSLMQLQAQMDLIKKMGFNTVRIVGIGETTFNKQKKLISEFAIGNKKDSSIVLNNSENDARYFNALSDLFTITDRAGLKVILLVRMVPNFSASDTLFEKITNRFKNEPTLMAYDFFNEPLYFDSIPRKKKDIYLIVKNWSEIQKRNAAYQLSTIGLEGIREVFKWDPTILDVDFISYHPYEYETEQVRNEMYWYGKYTGKPWIIGETAIAADNDSVTYQQQKYFAEKTLTQAYNCGAIGYSWWQYKDVDWGNYSNKYMGVVNQKGTTKVNGFTVYGTVKPVVEAFKHFNPKAVKGKPVFLPNYYNYSQFHTYRLIGHLVDENNKPIQGGVVLGWNQYWLHSYHTITKPDGSFELLGDFKFYHWIASAVGKTAIRGEINPDSAKINPINKIPTLNLGLLKVKQLDFLNGKTN